MTHQRKYTITIPCFMKKDGKKISWTKPFSETGFRIGSQDDNTKIIAMVIDTPKDLKLDIVKDGNKIWIVVRDPELSEAEVLEFIEPIDWDEMISEGIVKDFWE